MSRPLGGALLALLLIGQSGSGQDAKIPKDVPPVMGSAVVGKAEADAKGEWTIRLTVPKVRWEVVGEVVPKKSWPELRAEVEPETRTLLMDGPSQLAPSRIVNVLGKELPRGEIVKRLAKETPVLVSLSGEMVDPYYLQLTREDALIVILGPRDGMPAPAWLPAKKPVGGK